MIARVVIARIARLLAALGVMAVIAVWPTPARAQVTPEPLELTGAGTGSVYALANLWRDAMFDSPSGVKLAYFDRGDKGGRGALSQGDVDFAISAMPFTQDELTMFDERKVGRPVSAPISVSALQFIVGFPNSSGPLKTATPSPEDGSCDLPEPPPACFATITPITGDLRIPADLIGQVMISPNASTSNTWTDPRFASPYTVGGLNVLDHGMASPVVRTDPGAANWYIQEFLRQKAPEMWQLRTQTEGLPLDVQSEDWPFQRPAGRSGEEASASLIGDALSTAIPLPQAPSPTGGNLGPVSPWAANEQFSRQAEKLAPNYLYNIQIQNGAGEWVSATTQTINTAVELGGGKALYGLDESVPGAYPLTWISNILVPSSGLSPEKATGIATMMRYGSGTGQSFAPLLNEGQLPASLAAKALAAADDIVTSNCKAANGKLVTVDGGGPYWPKSGAPPAKSLICQSTAASDVTPDAADTRSGVTSSSDSSEEGSDVGTLGSSSGDLGSGFSSDAVADVASDSGAVEAASAGATSGSVAPVARAAETAQPVSAQLPMQPPDDGRRTLDRLTTMLLGGAVFLVVRAGVRRMNKAPA